MNFDNIRAFEDFDVESKIKSLLSDSRFFNLLSSYFFPKTSKILPNLANKIIRRRFKKEFGLSSTIEEFQSALEPYVSSMVKKTTDGFSFSGIENLTDEPTLFVSNHRDIALDAAFLNLVLFNRKLKTLRIAIGNNLLDGAYAELFMRLNKSFIVHRDIKGTKETYKRLFQLSSYINKSIMEDNENIWIAQREGRANDGNDFTDAAVLKMLYLSSRKKKSFRDWLMEVNLTPVSISYEFDPLDIIKANGWEGWKDLSYEENNKRDLKELAMGILGYKGKVHLHICKKINNVESLEELVNQIDEAIIKNYRLWPSNYISAYELGIIKENNHIELTKSFLSRYKTANKEVQQNILNIYAAPLVNSLNKIGNLN